MRRHHLTVLADRHIVARDDKVYRICYLEPVSKDAWFEYMFLARGCNGWVAVTGKWSEVDAWFSTEVPYVFFCGRYIARSL